MGEYSDKDSSETEGELVQDVYFLAADVSSLMELLQRYKLSVSAGPLPIIKPKILK